MNQIQPQSSHPEIREAIARLAEFLHLECGVEIIESEGETGRMVAVALSAGGDARFLIGRNGQNLEALEHLLRLVHAHSCRDQGLLMLDINDYRKTKALHAVELARGAATRVRNNQKAEALLPMSGYERRMVHMELASYPDIVTESIGEGSNRRVVIKPFP